MTEDRGVEVIWEICVSARYLCLSRTLSKAMWYAGDFR